MKSDNEVNILLVDDQPKNLLALEAILAGSGRNLIKAHSGPEALRCLLRDDFALILMDVLMPGMDGFETAALIRERDRSSHTPIIFLTAAGMSETYMFKGYSVGAVDYLFKPIEPEVLRSKVTVFVDLFKKTQEIKRQSEQLRDFEQREHERQLAEAQQRWEAERRQLEVHTARSIQQKLFPAAAPALAGFDIFGMSHPAEDMGGDYFDYLPLPAESCAIAIGDVCGHGMGPALLMATTRAYLHVLALRYTDMGEILALANRALAADVGDGRFVTLLLGRLDCAARSFVYASAGHHPGFVLGPSGDVRKVLRSTGVPLGIEPDSLFPAAPEIVLDAGDLVLLLTDGLAETTAPDGQPFGMERALEVVLANQLKPARAIVQSLYEAVRAFAQHQPQVDDITAIVIKLERTL